MLYIFRPGFMKKIAVAGLLATMIIMGRSGPTLAAPDEENAPAQENIAAKKLLGKTVNYSTTFSVPTVFPSAPQKFSPQPGSKPGPAVAAGGDDDDNTSFFFDMQREIEVDMETWQGQAGVKIDW